MNFKSNSSLQTAVALLDSGPYSCVLCREDTVETSDQRGIRPLLDWYLAGRIFSGFSAADRIVGRAAAFLYVLLDVRAVYAPVMSQGAADVFSQNGIDATFGKLVTAIRNRTGDGICPMEAAVASVTQATEAPYVLLQARKALEQLQQQTEM